MRRPRSDKHWTPPPHDHHQSNTRRPFPFRVSSLPDFRHLFKTFILPSKFGRLQFLPLPNEGDKTCRHIYRPYMAEYKPDDNL